MKTTFEIGDLVTLKSSSPAMTVEGQDKDKKILCVWFNKKGEKCSSSFLAETLNKSSEEDLLCTKEPFNTIEVPNIEEALSAEKTPNLEETEKQKKSRTKKTPPQR